MSIKLTTGQENFEILDTGTVITFKEEPITFTIEGDLTITLVFLTDKDVTGQKWITNRQEKRPLN